MSNSDASNNNTDTNPSDEDETLVNVTLVNVTTIFALFVVLAVFIYCKYAEAVKARTTVPHFPDGGPQVELDITFCATTRTITVKKIHPRGLGEPLKVPVDQLLDIERLKKEPECWGCVQLPPNYKEAFIDPIEKMARSHFNIEKTISIYYSELHSQEDDRLKLPAFVKKITSSEFIYPEKPLGSNEIIPNDHTILYIQLDEGDINLGILDQNIAFTPIHLKDIPLRDDGNIDLEQVITLLNQRMKEGIMDKGLSQDQGHIVLFEEDKIVGREEFFQSIQSAVHQRQAYQAAQPLSLEDLSSVLGGAPSPIDENPPLTPSP